MYEIHISITPAIIFELVRVFVSIHRIASLPQFKTAFSAAAAGQFGSGWAWLVCKNRELSVMKTPNAETPMTAGFTPLLTCDVWEHAYYIDYRNDRAAYINGFWKLCNWSSVFILNVCVSVCVCFWGACLPKPLC